MPILTAKKRYSASETDHAENKIKPSTEGFRGGFPASEPDTTHEEVILVFGTGRGSPTSITMAEVIYRHTILASGTSGGKQRPWLSEGVPHADNIRRNAIPGYGARIY